MDYTQLKPFLKSFWQIISIFKIFTLQSLSLFFLSYSCGLLAEATRIRGCPPHPEAMGWFLYGSLFVGLGFGVLSIHPIVFPRIWLEEVTRELTGSKMGFRYPFFSTHPSYVLLDLLLLIPAILLYWSGQREYSCEFNREWGQGTAALVIALVFPTLRLICWFLLGRKIFAMQVKNVWLGIIWWYVLVLPIVILFCYTYVQSNVMPRLNAPLVDSETFKGGLDAHPEFLDKVVRVRGVLKQGIAKCGLFGKKDRNDYPSGTVVLDLGDGNGEIMVQAKKPSQVLSLEGDSFRGGTLEAFGRLSKLPNPEKKLLCGIGKLTENPPPGGRALLEIELPK